MMESSLTSHWAIIECLNMIALPEETCIKKTGGEAVIILLKDTTGNSDWAWALMLSCSPLKKSPATVLLTDVAAWSREALLTSSMQTTNDGITMLQTIAYFRITRYQNQTSRCNLLTAEPYNIQNLWSPHALSRSVVRTRFWREYGRVIVW